MENFQKISSDNKAAAVIVTLAIGAAAWYMYPKKPAALKPAVLKPAALNPAAPEFIPKSMQYSKLPAPIATNITLDPVTGKPKITPPNQTVHKALDVYGEVAPGGLTLEISEEHAKQKIKDAKEEEEISEALKRGDEEEGVRTEDKNVRREVESESDTEESSREPESSVFGSKLPGMYESDG